MKAKSGTILALITLLAIASSASSAQGTSNYRFYSFRGSPDGANPLAGVIQDGSGNLYGTAIDGGVSSCAVSTTGCGVVFKVDRTGKETVLYRFNGGPDGGEPDAELVGDADGNLYGTTFYGGNATCVSQFGCGVVFKLDTSGVETVLHAFTGGWDGGFPESGLIKDNAGNLYGVSQQATKHGGQGTAFKLNASGKEVRRHSFTGSPSDGQDPSGRLIHDEVGNLYGATYGGGTFGFGTVFKIRRDGLEMILYNFTGGQDGGMPSAGLIRDADGNLYGTTEFGGSLNAGTVFKLDASGVETVLHSFTGQDDGGFPRANLIRDSEGNIYSTAVAGGPSGCGTIFEIDALGMFAILYSFSGPEGCNPAGGVIQDHAGTFHGTTIFGGDFDEGTVFSFTP